MAGVDRGYSVAVQAHRGQEFIAALSNSDALGAAQQPRTPQPGALVGPRRRALAAEAEGELDTGLHDTEVDSAAVVDGNTWPCFARFAANSTASSSARSEILLKMRTLPAVHRLLPGQDLAEERRIDISAGQDQDSSAV